MTIDETGPLRVLAVCTANICRSATIATLLDRHLGPDYVRAASAGTRALAGYPMCSIAVQWLTSRGLVDAEPDHRSRPVELWMIDSADLIVTADRTHRAALAVLAPKATSRTFTLREAVALSSRVVETTGRPHEGRGEALAWLVRQMHGARGTVPLAGVASARRRRGPIIDVLDVPDAHEPLRLPHEPTMELLTASVRTLASNLKQVASAARSPGS